jgi:hypothetical protein
MGTKVSTTALFMEGIYICNVAGKDRDRVIVVRLTAATDRGKLWLIAISSTP